MLLCMDDETTCIFAVTDNLAPHKHVVAGERAALFEKWKIDNQVSRKVSGDTQ